MFTTRATDVFELLCVITSPSQRHEFGDRSSGVLIWIQWTQALQAKGNHCIIVMLITMWDRDLRGVQQKEVNINLGGKNNKRTNSLRPENETLPSNLADSSSGDNRIVSELFLWAAHLLMQIDFLSREESYNARSGLKWNQETKLWWLLDIKGEFSETKKYNFSAIMFY